MLKYLKKCLESEKKDKAVFDIVIYGSSVKGKEKPGDIDVMVIFLEGDLRERLDKVQKIKNKLKQAFKDKSIDVKQMLLKEIFSSEFLARTGILLEGISIFKDKKFCEMLGFKAFVLFWYSLKGLTHTQKIRFNYILAGRNSSKGMIKELKGERLVKGAVKMPIENSIEFEEIIKANNINYKKKSILEEI